MNNVRLIMSAVATAIVAVISLYFIFGYHPGDLVNLFDRRQISSDETIARYSEAIKNNPDDATNYNSRGIAYSNRGKYNLGIADFDKAIELDPEYAAAWNNKGAALENLGRLEKALQSYNKALQLNPSNQIAKNNRDRLLARMSPGSGDTGGSGIQTAKSLTGEWINDTPHYGLEAKIQASMAYYDVVLNLTETGSSFTGTMQQTMRNLTGPAANIPEFRSQIGKTNTFSVSGTRDGTVVRLDYGGIILNLSYEPKLFGGGYLHGDTTIYQTYAGPTNVQPGSGVYETRIYSIYLRQK